MLKSNETANKRETLNIRIKPEERMLIDRAAKARGKNRTYFILNAARLAAEEVLLDRKIITVSPEIYAEFVAGLDMPPGSNERLARPCKLPLLGTMRDAFASRAVDCPSRY